MFQNGNPLVPRCSVALSSGPHKRLGPLFGWKSFGCKGGDGRREASKTWLEFGRIAKPELSLSNSFLVVVS